MARPIIPVSIARRDHGAAIEVQSKGGIWLPLAMVSDTVKQQAYNIAVSKGYLKSPDTYPLGEFMWDLEADAPHTSPDRPEDSDRNSQPTQPDNNGPTDQTDSDSESDTETESDDPSDSDDNNNQQSEQQQDTDDAKEHPMMEDIVRRIAGELDNAQQATIDAQLQSLEERLADTVVRQEQHTTSLVPVCTRVEIVLPETTVQTDGLFHQSMPDLLFNIQLGVHTYLPGTPGTGKSHAAAQAAQALGWEFGSISFGPQTPESRLVGGMVADGKFFEPMLIQLIRHAMANPDSGAVMCLDEMDNGHPGVQATLNSLLANGWMTAPNGDHLVIGQNLVFIACANTFGTGPTAEFSGRNKLDAATLDRFAYLPWEIDLGLEEALVRRFFADDNQQVASHWLDVWRTARSNVQAHGLKLFVTPRGAQAGARMVAAGRSVEKSLAQVLGNKVPADQWSKINPL